MKIDISHGELFDRYSILLIKLNKINDIVKVNMVKKELATLDYYEKTFNIRNHKLFKDLLKINSILWQIEDDIRIKEYKKEFDNEFIELARSVYINNDERFLKKTEINNFFKSYIYEVKNHLLQQQNT
tara:strand:+ start:161 stop:544 length:384 start_codon:yes stop_codon:yes gene_type:complete